MFTKVLGASWIVKREEDMMANGRSEGGGKLVNSCDVKYGKWDG